MELVAGGLDASLWQRPRPVPAPTDNRPTASLLQLLKTCDEVRAPACTSQAAWKAHEAQLEEGHALEGIIAD